MTPTIKQTSTKDEPLSKIVVVITKADIGGAQVHVHQILGALGGQYEFVLVTGEEDFLTREVRKLGVEVVIVPNLIRAINLRSDFLAFTEIYKLLRYYRPALVHAHSFKAGVIARVSAIFARIPALFTAHGWAFTPGAPKTRRIFGFLIESVMCRVCRGVVTISRHDFILASKWHVGWAEKRYLVPNAVKNVGSNSASVPEKATVQLLSVGRLTSVKNQLLLLRVVDRLPKQVQLTIIGEGDQRRAIESEIAKLDLASRISLAGDVVNISEFYAAADIFVLSSAYEGLPMSILEAMSAGLPVVSTDVGGVNEAVIDGETGFLVPRGDEEQFTKKIRQLLDAPHLRQSLGEQGKRHYHANYQLDRFITQMGAVYEQVIN